MGEVHSGKQTKTETRHEQRSRQLWTAAIVLFVALSGLGMQMRGALLPELASQWGVGDGVLGLVGPAGTVGYLVTVLAVGAVAGRIDTRRYLLGGLVVISVAVVGMGLAPFFVAYLGFLVVRGFGTGVVRALDRPLLGHLYPDARGRVFNLYDLAWAIGAAAGPAVMSLAIVSGNWRLAYYGLAIGVVVILLFIWFLDTPDDGGEKPLDLPAAVRLLRTPAIAATAVAMIFHTGLEGAMFIWLPTFGIRIAGLDPGTANLLLSAFTISYIPGRFIFAMLAGRIDYGPLVVGLELLIAPVFLWTFFVASGPITFLGVAVLGVLVSGVYPTLLAFGTEAAPEYSAPVNAIASATSSVSLAMVPLIMGVLAETYGIGDAMWLPLVLTLAVAPVVVVARRVDPSI